jgi:hypothetical protein
MRSPTLGGTGSRRWGPEYPFDAAILSRSRTLHAPEGWGDYAPLYFYALEALELSRDTFAAIR